MCGMQRKVSGSCRNRAAPGPPQVAARQQQPQPAQGRGQAGERPGLLDDRVQAGQVGPVGLQVQRARHVEHRHQAVRVGGGQAGPGGGEGVAADQGQPLVLGHLEAGVGDDPVGQVGHRAQVALADRTERADRRGETLIEQGDDQLGQFGPYAGDALGVAVGQAEHGAADHVGRGHVTLGDAVVQNQAVVEPLPFGRIEQVGLTLTDPRGQAVNHVSACENALDHGPGPAHSVDRLWR